MHAVAPALLSKSVTDPAPHVTQATVELALYRPRAQTVQLVAPGALSVLVIHPGEQGAHASVDTELY